MFDKFNKLVNGLIGRVIEEGVEEDGFFVGEDDGVVVEGRMMFVGECVGGIDEFEFDEEKLVLFRGDGYRGVECYNGVVEKDGKWFWLDVVNDYLVYELEEKS